MKKTFQFIFISIFALFIAACATSSSSHWHASPPEKIRDRYHAAMEYNPDSGRISIVFFNESERAVELFSGHEAKGEIISGDIKESLHFEKANRRNGYRYQRDYATSRIEVREEWLKDLDEFKLKAWVRISGTVHELTFVYTKEV